MASTVGLLNNTITAENKIRIERANLILEAEGNLFRQLVPGNVALVVGSEKKPLA